MGGAGASVAVYDRGSLELLYVLRFPHSVLLYLHMGCDEERLGFNLRPAGDPSGESSGVPDYRYCEW